MEVVWGNIEMTFSALFFKDFREKECTLLQASDAVHSFYLIRDVCNCFGGQLKDVDIIVRVETLLLRQLHEDVIR